MTTRLKLKPGQKGTKKLFAEHGDALVCVRYRYDEASGTRIKTVELIVEKISWQPSARKFCDNDLVSVRIGFAEKDLMESAKAAKGRWNPEARLWFIRFGKIKGTTLEKRFFSRICGRFSVPATCQVYGIRQFAAFPHSENHTLFS